MSKRKYPNILEKLQQEVGEWSFENFGKAKGLNRGFHDLVNTNDPLLGMVEELGHLCRSVLKQKQGIRTNENHEAQEKDDIGDLMIYLLDYCSRRGFSASDILKETWAKVSGRDWTKNPVDGSKEVNPLTGYREPGKVDPSDYSYTNQL